MLRRRLHKGVTTVQTVLVVAAVTLAIIAGVSLIATRTNTKLGQTATDVGNPSSLTTRFGS